MFCFSLRRYIQLIHSMMKNLSSKESTPPSDSAIYPAKEERRLSLADYLLILKHVGRNQVWYIFVPVSTQLPSFLTQPTPHWATIAHWKDRHTYYAKFDQEQKLPLCQPVFTCLNRRLPFQSFLPTCLTYIPSIFKQLFPFFILFSEGERKTFT